MSLRQRSGGYSAALVEDVLISDAPIYAVTDTPDISYVYDKANNRPTDQVEKVRYTFTQPGLTGTFEVKFPPEFKTDLKLFDVVKLKGLQACQVDRNIYFRADGLEVVTSGK